jgi:DNA gyrase subunit A
LINGSTGIAVGMATNMAPHNITEVCNAVKAIIENPEIELAELMNHITGPDFPTGGRIAGKAGIYQAYSTGKGRVRVKGVTEIEEGRIIISEIPYQVSKAALVEEIANNVKDKRIEGVRDIRDESDRKGMRVVIELKQGANAEIIENLLYKYTRLQVTFGVYLKELLLL